MTSVRETVLFPTEAVLTVTTDRMLCSDIGMVYEILNHMTGDNLFTHQLPRAAGKCAPALLEQHPQLVGVTVPDGLVGEVPIRAWIAEVIEQFGAELPVAPLPAGAHEVRDPLSELIEMRGGAPVSVVVVQP